MQMKNMSRYGKGVEPVAEGVLRNGRVESGMRIGMTLPRKKRCRCKVLNVNGVAGL